VGVLNKLKISPRLYKLEAIASHDTITLIFTDICAANKAESELWDAGGICSTSIDYAHASVDGVVIWHNAGNRS